MADKRPLVQNPPSTEVAMVYFRERLAAINGTLVDFEQARREGRLTEEEFFTVRRSLIGARREIESALVSI